MHLARSLCEALGASKEDTHLVEVRQMSLFEFLSRLVMSVTAIVLVIVINVIVIVRKENTHLVVVVNDCFNQDSIQYIIQFKINSGNSF